LKPLIFKYYIFYCYRELYLWGSASLGNFGVGVSRINDFVMRPLYQNRGEHCSRVYWLCQVRKYRFSYKFCSSVSLYSNYPLNHSAASSKMTVTAFCPHGTCMFHRFSEWTGTTSNSLTILTSRSF